MNFELNDEQKLIQHTAREFAREEILLVAAACDSEARFPMGWCIPFHSRTHVVRTAHAGYREDDTGRTIDFANNMIFGIGHIDIAMAIDRYPLRLVQTGLY